MTASAAQPRDLVQSSEAFWIVFKASFAATSQFTLRFQARRGISAKRRPFESTWKTPAITTPEHSPDRGQGLVRGMSARWALEKAGRPYDFRLLSFAEMKKPAHLALQPFGSIPPYEEGSLALFESGAIVFHIAERHAGPMPGYANARAPAITWLFAALNTMEPPIVELETVMTLECKES